MGVFKTCTQEQLEEWLRQSPPCDWDVASSDEGVVWIRFYTHTTDGEKEVNT